MKAPAASVAKVQKELGCGPYDGTLNALDVPICDRHFDPWTDRGCPVAVAAADEAIQCSARRYLPAFLLTRIQRWARARRTNHGRGAVTTRGLR